MYGQLREGLSTEISLLCSAARSQSDVALLSRVGCALLRTGALQCYTRLLSDAAWPLQPAAQAACADLPDWPEVVALEAKLKEVQGCSTQGMSAAVVSGALRLAGEAVQLMEVLGACSGGEGEPGDASSTALRKLYWLLEGGPEAVGATTNDVEQGSISGDTGMQGRCHDAFQEAREEAMSSGHVFKLYQHASRLLLLATAAARTSGTHQRTHAAASQLSKQLVARISFFEHEAASVTCSHPKDCGSALAELVQLCAGLDGGTTYGMALGLWPLPGDAGAGRAGGAGGAEAGASLLAVVRLYLTLQSWGTQEGPAVMTGMGPTLLQAQLWRVTRGV